MKLMCMIGYHKLITIYEAFNLLSNDLLHAGTINICIKKCKHCKHIEISLDRLKLKSVK